MDKYEIWMANEVVGTATVDRQGLYYCFTCSCRIKGDAICRVVVSCDGHHENLGILVPGEKGFVLTTRLAVKKLGMGPLRFCIIPKHGSCSGQFVPVYPEEPFAYLTRLQNAFLEVCKGQVGVVISE